MSRYKNTKVGVTDITPNRRKQSMKFDTTIYDNIPERNDDIRIITQQGDRLDNLAFQFYGDPSLWWFLARANGLTSMNVDVGINLRVPAKKDMAKGS
jgi:hypothetical protein|tara:strand:- start:372 stop:662 length:291 start_codon:yes stop_codon:yes gene_type:complete